jgi:hypothetical protein
VVLKGTLVELTDPATDVPIASISLGEGSMTKDYVGESCSFGGDEDHVKITSDAVRVTVGGLTGSVIERVSRWCDVERCRFLIDSGRPTSA